MRQSGILAAAGIMALEKMTGRIEDDHRNARALGEGLQKIDGVALTDSAFDINMVYFTFKGAPAADNGGWVKAFAERGIVISAPDRDGVFRFVTHEQVSAADVGTILAISREVFNGNRGV
jgi:threonine aldolase